MWHGSNKSPGNYINVETEQVKAIIKLLEMLGNYSAFKREKGWANYRKPSDVLKSNNGTFYHNKTGLPSRFWNKFWYPLGCWPTLTTPTADFSHLKYVLIILLLATFNELWNYKWQKMDKQIQCKASIGISPKKGIILNLKNPKRQKKDTT